MNVIVFVLVVSVALNVALLCACFIWWWSVNHVRMMVHKGRILEAERHLTAVVGSLLRGYKVDVDPDGQVRIVGVTLDLEGQP